MRARGSLLVMVLALAACGIGPTDAEIEHAITIRAELGLSTDRAHVIRVINDPTADLSHGAPLLAEEAADAEARGWERGHAGALIWYGIQHPDQYAGSWSDDGTTVLLAFTGDAERHREALRAIAPGAAIRVEPVEFSEAELWAIMDGLEEDADLLAERGIVLNGHGLMNMSNRVELDAKAPDPAAAERWLEDRYGPGLVATVIPLPGPWSQAPSGPGWRLLASGPGGRNFSVAAAQSEDALARVWAEWQMPDDVPTFDPATEVVVFLGWSVSGSCPETRLDRIVFDEERHRVYGEFSDPLAPRFCTMDARSYTFVVALERDTLPAPPFEVRLWEEGGPDCCEETSVIEITPR